MMTAGDRKRGHLTCCGSAGTDDNENRFAKDTETETFQIREYNGEDKYHWKLDQNHKMHPRNKYWKNPPNFQVLAARYPDFGKHLFKRKEYSTTSYIDWRDPEACHALTQTLLLHDFKLKWEIPQGFLCPPVPNRANYLHWIEDLLAGPLECATSHPHDVRVPQNMTGLDIGVGASCIYPLLGVRLNPTWSFIASDVNEDALASAQANIERNGLGIRSQHNLNNMLFLFCQNRPQHSP